MYDAYAMQHAVMHGCYACAYDAPVRYIRTFIQHRVHTAPCSYHRYGAGLSVAIRRRPARPGRSYAGVITGRLRYRGRITPVQFFGVASVHQKNLIKMYWRVSICMVWFLCAYVNPSVLVEYFYLT